MINSLHLRNFKGIRQADVGLERLTVIVGPNSSGKTSVLQALDILGKLESYDPQEIFRGRFEPGHIYHRAALTEEMELSASGPETNIRLRVLPPPSRSNGEIPRIERTVEGWAFFVEARENGTEDDGWRAIREVPTAYRMHHPAIHLRLEPSHLVNPSIGSSTFMKADGRGLSSSLAFIALNQPDDFQVIQNQLRMVVPSIERIRFDQVTQEDNSVAHQLLFDFRNARHIPAHSVSEGTILVLGLLTALMNRKYLSLVLLDDLDHGLHPKAQGEVVRLLRAIMDQNPDLQIVATTHSPYLVDCLDPEEVRLTTLGDDGNVCIASLVDHPDFDHWKDEMAPGEMWSLFGEDWVSKPLKNSVEK